MNAAIVGILTLAMYFVSFLLKRIRHAGGRVLHFFLAAIVATGPGVAAVTGRADAAAASEGTAAAVKSASPTTMSAASPLILPVTRSPVFLPDE